MTTRSPPLFIRAIQVLLPLAVLIAVLVAWFPGQVVWALEARVPANSYIGSYYHWLSVFAIVGLAAFASYVKRSIIYVGLLLGFELFFHYAIWNAVATVFHPSNINLVPANDRVLLLVGAILLGYMYLKTDDLWHWNYRLQLTAWLPFLVLVVVTGPICQYTSSCVSATTVWPHLLSDLGWAVNGVGFAWAVNRDKTRRIPFSGA